MTVTENSRIPLDPPGTPPVPPRRAERAVFVLRDVFGMSFVRSLADRPRLRRVTPPLPRRAGEHVERVR
jgi:hypothetical protein